MIPNEPHSGEGGNFVGRRFAAFLIDIVFAVFVVTSVPAAIVELSLGRVRVAGVPGFGFTYCHPENSISVSTGAITERMQKSPPPGTSYFRNETCTSFINLIYRNHYTQVEFSSLGRIGSFVNYSIPTDYNGDAIHVLIITVPPLYFEFAYLAVLLIAARLDGPGIRLLGMRIRSKSGA